MPMERGACVDCGALVGGTNHKPEHGFTAIQYVHLCFLLTRQTTGLGLFLFDF